MKDNLFVFLSFMPCCLCVLAAAFLAVKKVDGWGWFLLLAVLLCPSKIKTGSDADEGADETAVEEG